jgi:hypothetical protein
MELKAKQDYTKVGGWLKFFGIIAGVAFLLHLIVFVVRQERWLEIMRQTNAKDDGFVELDAAFGLLLAFIALAQCFCIFKKRRLGRTLSLIFYGYVSLLNLYRLFTLWIPISSFEADPTSSVLILLGGIGGVIMHAVPFAYFLFSERVEKTLVN